jgi:hypothetical protein
MLKKDVVGKPSNPRERRKKSSKEKLVDILANVGIFSATQSGITTLEQTPRAVQEALTIKPPAAERLAIADDSKDQIQFAMDYFELDVNKPQDIIEFQNKLTSLTNNVILLQQAISKNDKTQIKKLALSEKDQESIRVLIGKPQISQEDWKQFFMESNNLDNNAVQVEQIGSQLEMSEEAKKALIHNLSSIVTGLMGLGSTLYLKVINTERE